MSNLDSSIEKLASQCVRCGLCLNHCPTYVLNETETESPRGRIALLANYAKTEIWDSSLQQHIDQCLACGHCERVCPAEVAYLPLLIKGRKSLSEKKPISKKKEWLIKFIEKPYFRNTILFFIKVLQILKSWNFLIKCTALFFPKIANKLKLFPKLSFKKFKKINSFSKTEKEKVLLFFGCTGDNLGSRTKNACQNILNQLGYQILNLPKSVCCGALSTYLNGNQETSKSTEAFLKKFCEKEAIKQVIGFATGCDSFMKKTIQSSGINIIDIQEFLLKENKLKNLFAKTQKKLRIAVHAPCTQTNSLKSPDLSLKLLKFLPQLELKLFGENTCCGAAGLYMIEQPGIAERLVEKLLTPELLENADIIVTSNIGCQLHFQYFLSLNQISIPVLHPIEIINQYYFFSDAVR